MLTPGSRLGPYEIVSLLGKGAMGEVYRARDARLDRDVAVKVLPPGVSLPPEVLRRFAEEARSASALAHPNVVTVHDLGEIDGSAFLVMELVEGSSLREIVKRGKLPFRKAASIAAQIADGLAAAHARGIVHRDLKPENVVVDREGRAKIVDFGLAKSPRLPAAGPLDPTVPDAGYPQTEPGTLLGTVGYMSPEQARGEPVDFRSDQFALGSIVFEMFEGKRAFSASSAAETLAKIIREPAPSLSLAGLEGEELRWILERCHAKDPADRYGSTRDLHRDLRRFEERFSRGSPRASPAAARGGRLLAVSLAVAAVAAFFAAAAAWRSRTPPALPLFQQLTFRRGALWSARFAGDGRTIVYGAAWDGGPFDVYSTRFPATNARPLGRPGANLLAVSEAGELAVSLASRPVLAGVTSGTLARQALEGGPPREVLEGVLFADWNPKGEALAVVRSEKGEFRLEYPPGTVLVRTSGWISHPRFSPGGRTIAFLDHPSAPDDRGRVSLVDLSGRRRDLTPEWPSAMGLAWSPAGDEIWFAATGAEGSRALRSVSRDGARARVLTRAPGDLTLQDVSREGRVLATRENLRIGIVDSAEGAELRDVSWLDRSLATDLSEDGRTILFTEFGEGGGARYGAFLRRPGESLPLPLGEGFATSLAVDGKSVLSIVPTSPPGLVSLPTGAGAAVRVPCGDVYPVWAVWFPSGRRVLLAGMQPGREVRLYWTAPNLAEPRPLAAEGVTVSYGGGIRVSPDEKSVAAIGSDGAVKIFPVAGGSSAPVAGLESGFVPLRWSGDARSLYVSRFGEMPSGVYRVDLATGAKTTIAELVPPDPTGVIGIPSVEISADGKTRVYSYARSLGELYLIDGLK
ncbi:MAG TPA: protein kinase [Thermoanaerobaculia bacterium]|nr:protein kinase [Thermoanaerobaculia bacterium]